MINYRPLELRDYFAILRRRKWFIVFPTLLAAAATFFFVRSLPNLYRSETLILVEQQNVPEAYVRSTVQADLPQRLQTLTHQIFSRTRLQAIIERLGLYRYSSTGSVDELVAQLRKDIEIELVPRRDQPGVAGFKIYYQAPSPQLAQNVVRELTALLIEENLRVREQQAVGTTQFLDAQLEHARLRLQEQEGRLREFKTRYFGELPSEQDTNLALLGQLNIQLQANADRLNRQEQEKTYLESLLAAQTAVRRPGSVSVDTSTRRLEELQTRLLDLENKYTPDHPDILATKREIQRLQAARAEAEQKKRTGSGDETTASVGAAESAEEAQIRSRLEAVELAHQQILQEREQIQEQIRTLQRRVSITPLREQQLTDLTRDYEVAQQQYDSLLQKKHEAEIAADLERRQQGEQFRVLDPPSLPTTPYKPNRLLFDLLGLGGGLLLGFGLVVAAELKDESLRSERDVSYYVNLPTLATVPRIRALARRRRLMRKPQNKETQADALRN